MFQVDSDQEHLIGSACGPGLSEGRAQAGGILRLSDADPMLEIRLGSGGRGKQCWIRPLGGSRINMDGIFSIKM